MEDEDRKNELMKKIIDVYDLRVLGFDKQFSAAEVFAAGALAYKFLPDDASKGDFLNFMMSEIKIINGRIAIAYRNEG